MVIMPGCKCCRTCGYELPTSIEVDFAGSRTAYQWAKIRRNNFTKETVVFGWSVPETVSLSLAQVVDGVYRYCWSDITHKYVAGSNSFAALAPGDGSACGTTTFSQSVAGGAFVNVQIRPPYLSLPGVLDPVEAQLILAFTLCHRQYARSVPNADPYPDPLSQSFVCGNDWKTIPSGWVGAGRTEFSQIVNAQRRCFVHRPSGISHHSLALANTSFTSCVMPITSTVRRNPLAHISNPGTITGVDETTLQWTNVLQPSSYFYNLNLQVTAVRLIYEESERSLFIDEGDGVTC